MTPITARTLHSISNSRYNGETVSVSTPLQKMNSEVKFENRLRGLLSHVEHSDVVYGKVILGVHHLIIVNWKVLEQDILGKCKLWGRTTRYTTFNRQIMLQGYQKIKLQVAKGVQKVLVYLRSVDKMYAPKSHIPCFIPIEEIKRKQASLEIKYKSTLSVIRKFSSKRCRTYNCDRILSNPKTKSKSKSKSTMTEEIIKEFNKLDFNSLKNDDENKMRTGSTTEAGEVMLEAMFLKLIDENTERLVSAVLAEDTREDDELLWNPSILPEFEVIEYLRNCAVDKTIMRTRQPDVEEHLCLLNNCKYDLPKARKINNNNKAYYIEKEPDGANWTTQMKMNFEKGLIIHGEKMEDIFHHFSCFANKDFNLIPFDLELYFHSNSRYNFINDPGVSKRIVDQLDKTSHKHLQSINTHEVCGDWARMRQNISMTSSDSDNSPLKTCLVTQYGRIVRQVQIQKAKKRPKRLPNRFRNYHM